jgi:hypothetical protein
MTHGGDSYLFKLQALRLLLRAQTGTAARARLTQAWCATTA